MPRFSGSLNISGHPTDPIEIACQKRGRHGRYLKTALIQKHGSDIVLPDLLALIAGDCEFKGERGNQGCGAIHPALGVPIGCDRLNISKVLAIKGIFYVSKVGLF